MELDTFFFQDEIIWSSVPKWDLNFYSWESDFPFRPKTHAQLAACLDAFVVKMQTDEKNIKATYTKLNDPCYKDSCMEFFIAPFSRHSGYINVEVNPLSAFLCEYGTSRQNRKKASNISKNLPKVNSTISKHGWETTIVLPFLLINDIFDKNFDLSSNRVHVNFFKCGDETMQPHFQSLSKMGSIKKGFHNPNTFVKVKFSNYEQN